MHEYCLNVERIWINRVTSEIVLNLHTRTVVLKLHDERIIAVQEEFDLHLESYQRGVTDGMRISWNFLLTWREGKLAKEIDESTSVVVDYVVVSLTVEQKAPRNVSWRYALSSRDSMSRKFPMRDKSIGRRSCYHDTNV